MFLAVFICLVTSSLIVFFLFPRTIAVQPVGLNSSTVTVGEADIHLNITVGGCLRPWAPTPPSWQHSSVYYLIIISETPLINDSKHLLQNLLSNIAYYKHHFSQKLSELASISVPPFYG